MYWNFIKKKQMFAAVAGFTLFISSALSAPAFQETGFEKWKLQQGREHQQKINEFDAYRSEIKASFKEYSRKTAEIWGRNNTLPNKKNWLSYIDSINQRSIVDFESGLINVEVALPVQQNVGDEQGKKQLEDVLLKAMKLGDDKRPIQQFAEQPISQPELGAVLKGLISLPDGEVAKNGDYKTLAREAAKNVSKKMIRGKDGELRVIYSAQLNLVPDHIRIRARKYQPLIDEYATKNQLPVALVFAVIETESMFNPTARSGAPAFGLMQLVPTSGARDAYRYLYKKDKVVSDTYLYDPENNIRLGSAYLYRLNTHYFTGIDSDQSRMLATIAAYNTGAGNVFRSFSGKYNRARFGNYSNYKKAALREINKRSPEQVYQFLHRHLPYRETRDYIKKVTERMDRYVAG
jgi:membrane-bound lytic murein transglycosylase C